MNSRFAYGDREAAALRADLDFAGLPQPRFAMRFEGKIWLAANPQAPPPLGEGDRREAVVERVLPRPGA